MSLKTISLPVHSRRIKKKKEKETEGRWGCRGEESEGRGGGLKEGRRKEEGEVIKYHRGKRVRRI